MYIVNDPQLSKEFLLWCSEKRRNIRSQRKLAYLFIKHKYGNKWIQWARRNVLVLSQDELMAIARVKWIKIPGEEE